MRRTIEDIQRDFELAKKELEPIEIQRNKAVKKVNHFYKELEQYKLNHGLYRPMSDLKEYIGKSIKHIELVYRDSDGKMQIEDMYNDELFKVDKEGHLDYSSYNCGVMHFNNGKYIYQYYGHPTEYDFLGFLDIGVEDETGVEHE